MVDRVVDKFFGEPMELHPWGKIGLSSEGEPDPERAVLYFTAILVMPGAAATGEAGAVSIGMSSRVVGMDVWISIQEDQLATAKLETWKEGDRLYVPDRDLWYQVQYGTPSVTARPQIELTRIQKADV